MDDTLITIYCLCDDFLKAINHRPDDPQTRLSTAEVMTITLVASTFFGGNIEKTRCFLHEYGYMKKMISKSHLNRRIHAIEPALWRVLFELLAQAFKQRNDPELQTYAVDSLPVAVWDNIRIRRCRIYPLEEEGHDDDTPKKKSFRGYIASKRRYFYGLGVHLVVTGAGEPVEFSLAAGSEADIAIFKELESDLPEGSIIFADKAYTDYDYEDLLEEEVGLHLKAWPKKKIERNRNRNRNVRWVWQWQAVSAQTTYDVTNKTVTVDPYGSSETLLAPYSNHLVIIGTEARDLAGNALAANESWYFSTGSD